MKLFLKIMISLTFIVIIEILIYLGFAFCYWDILWPAACCVFIRFLYLIFFAIGVALSIAKASYIIDETYD